MKSPRTEEGRPIRYPQPSYRPPVFAPETKAIPGEQFACLLADYRCLRTGIIAENLSFLRPHLPCPQPKSHYQYLFVASTARRVQDVLFFSHGTPVARYPVSDGTLFFTLVFHRLIQVLPAAPGVAKAGEHATVKKKNKTFRVKVSVVARSKTELFLQGF